ncbi:hypothetical protein Tco_1387857, partial [Tanacetum coccineum]
SRILFRGNGECRMSDINETQEIDLGDNQIDSVYKVQIKVVYPRFDPNILWDKMEPMLGMRYESPHKLKLASANYGVAHGFQFLYMKNDWRNMLVYCGKNMVEGRCGSKKVNKDRLVPNKVRTGVSKGKHGNNAVKNKKESKKLALFNHAGGLIEHYGKLYQYRQAILDSKLGFTCRLDVDEFSNGFVYFKRVYIYFKGVKDGWLAGCRKGLLDVVGDWLPDAEHRKCTRQMDMRCVTFENGISKSFNRAILGPRHKPIITMLEKIRLHIMRRLVAMNKIAFGLEDRIIPSIRKRDWVFFPSDQSYGVNLQNKVCACRMWELSDVLCVYVVVSRGVIG